MATEEGSRGQVEVPFDGLLPPLSFEEAGQRPRATQWGGDGPRHPQAVPVGAFAPTSTQLEPWWEAAAGGGQVSCAVESGKQTELTHDLGKAGTACPNGCQAKVGREWNLGLCRVPGAKQEEAVKCLWAFNLLLRILPPPWKEQISIP